MGKNNYYIGIIFLFIMIINGATCFAVANCGEGNHVFRTQIIDATEEKPGKITYTCEKCGYTYTDEIAPYGHHFSEKTEYPDCERSGRKIYTCTKCGYTYEEVFGRALGHDYRLYTETSPTEKSEGERVFKCSRCGEMYREKIPALNKQDISAGKKHTDQPGRHGSDNIKNNQRSEEKKIAEGIVSGKKVKDTHKYSDLNNLDYMLGSLEILLMAVFLPWIIIYQRILMWDKRQFDKYRKHHRRWKEII